ncbi:MAG: ribosome maturation factor RimM [Alphaproteobacteria bacterium]
MSGPEKRVCVGVVTGAHGVRGAVRVKSFTAVPEDVAGYGPLEDERGERRFALRLISNAKGGNAKGVLIAAIGGIDDRDRAEALRGLRLYLPRSALPPPEEDEYYHADLIGLTAALPDGAVLGTVRAVHDFGAGDTLEIERASGPPLMVPFTRAVVPVVDLDAGRLVIDPPPGLLDPPSKNPLPRQEGEGRVRGAAGRRERRDDPLTPALSPIGGEGEQGKTA